MEPADLLDATRAAECHPVDLARPDRADGRRRPGPHPVDPPVRGWCFSGSGEFACLVPLRRGSESITLKTTVRKSCKNVLLVYHVV
jgi:hypothetical protein